MVLEYCARFAPSLTDLPDGAFSEHWPYLPDPSAQLIMRLGARKPVRPATSVNARNRYQCPP
jgi:hypothetical protein